MCIIHEIFNMLQKIDQSVSKFLTYPQKTIFHADANLHTIKANYDNQFLCAHLKMWLIKIE